MSKRDLLSLRDLSPQEIRGLVLRAAELKRGSPGAILAGKTVVLPFQKPSLRTRASFHVAVQQLGGYSFYLGQEEVGLGTREPVSDVARVLSRYVDCIVARVFSHATMEELARYATVPVINALSDWEHPCQALADLLTVHEKRGRLEGVTIAYVGDGNNVARSLCLGAAAVGAPFTMASPPGYGLDDHTLSLARQWSGGEGDSRVRSLQDPAEAVRGADVVYTDVWTSMGQEEERERRRRDFAGYTVDERLLALAGRGALLMHPMPAHYGEEVSPGLLEHPQSVAYDQAENRLHAQKAVLEFLLGGR
ncbi:MAG: ornithine carbamoyltransferase [Dehalococcoidia bacterium]